MITGILLAFMMLCLESIQNTDLTFIGQCVVWGGIGLSVFGLVYCLWNLE